MTLSCWPCFSLPWPFVAPACVQQHPACWTSCCLGSGAHQHSMLTAQPPLSLCHIPSCMRPQLHSVLRKAHLKPSPYCLNFNYSCQLPCCQGCLCSSVLSFLQVMGRHQHKVFARHALHQQHSVEGGPPSSRSVGGQLPCMPCTSTIIPAKILTVASLSGGSQLRPFLSPLLTCCARASRDAFAAASSLSRPSASDSTSRDLLCAALRACKQQADSMNHLC